MKQSIWDSKVDLVVRSARNGGRTDKEIMDALKDVRIGDYQALEEASVMLLKRRQTAKRIR